jgi:integrase
MDKKMNMVGLTRNNSTWAYVRSIPKTLHSHPAFKGRKNYRRQLASITTSREEVLKLWERAHEDYEEYIAGLQQVNMPVIERNALLKRAEAFLRVHNLKPSMLAVVDENNPSKSNYERWSLSEMLEQSGIFDDMLDYAAKAGYLEQTDNPEPYNDDMPYDVAIQQQAWMLLQEPPQQNYYQHLFSDCWLEYVNKKGIDEQSREGKRVKSCFFRFIKLTGDHVITEKSVNDALVNYVDNREQERAQNTQSGRKPTPSPASIKRELNTLLAILRVGCKRFRIRINIERPEIREDVKETERHTFSTQEQFELVKVASDKTRSDYQPYKELIILIMVQTGTHITELLRLRRDKVILDGEVPHLILDGELKTSQRKRVLPLVFRVERIKQLAEMFADGSEYFFGNENAQRTADNYSAQLNKLCREVNSDSTSYSCRHAFKHLAYVKGIDAQILAILGGWSGKEAGLSRQMQGYGKSGLMNEDSLKRLEHSMLLINEHLIEQDICRKDSAQKDTASRPAVILPFHTYL